MNHATTLVRGSWGKLLLGVVGALVVTAASSFLDPLASLGAVQASASTTRPVITSFSATTPSPYTVQASSPLTLYKTGGKITLQANVTNGAVCTFSSNRPLPNLPMSVPCGSTISTAIPASGRKNPVVYKFRLRVLGEPRGRTHASVFVIVSTMTNPNPPPLAVLLANTWALAPQTEACMGHPVWLVSFMPDGTFDGSRPHFEFMSGTYTFTSTTVVLTQVGGVADQWSMSWSSATGIYWGLDSNNGCVWTLSGP